MTSTPQDSNTRTAFNHGFTEGGDVTLRSCDRIGFSAHSLFLSIASPIFAEMIIAATHLPGVDGLGSDSQRDITVEESAEMVALMLKFIYPCPPPHISSFEQLDQALHVADKYQLKGMKTRLREQLLLQNSSVSISANPLRALAVASAHELHEEADAATSLASNRYRFNQVDRVVNLAETIPSAAPFIRLVGGPLVRIQVLADVLFSFHQHPMELAPRDYSSCVCSFCSRRHCGSPPEWLARWAYAVFTELKGRPVQQWDPFFKVGFFNVALHRGGEVPIQLSRSQRPREGERGPIASEGRREEPPRSLSTCECPDLINRHWEQFEQWTRSVHERLISRLQTLDQLEWFKLL